MTVEVGYCSVAVKRAGSTEWEQIMSYVHNTFTNAGRDLAHAQMYTNTSAGTRGAGFIAVSADTGTPAAGDTALTGEIATGGLTRADATTPGKAHSAGTNTSTVGHTFTASSAHTAVHKAALFNASSGVTMAHAAVFSSDVTLAINDQLQVTFTLTMG